MDKRALYGEDEIFTLDFDDGASFEVGIMGIFDLDDETYIALDSLEEESNDVYLYGYVATEDDFELLDIPDKDFERVAKEFNRLMDEPL